MAATVASINSKENSDNSFLFVTSRNALSKYKTKFYRKNLPLHRLKWETILLGKLNSKKKIVSEKE